MIISNRTFILLAIIYILILPDCGINNINVENLLTIEKYFKYKKTSKFCSGNLFNKIVSMSTNKSISRASWKIFGISFGFICFRNLNLNSSLFLNNFQLLMNWTDDFGTTSLILSCLISISFGIALLSKASADFLFVFACTRNFSCFGSSLTSTTLIICNGVLDRRCGNFWTVFIGFAFGLCGQHIFNSGDFLTFSDGRVSIIVVLEVDGETKKDESDGKIEVFSCFFSVGGIYFNTSELELDF